MAIETNKSAVIDDYNKKKEFREQIKQIILQKQKKITNLQSQRKTIKNDYKKKKTDKMDYLQQIEAINAQVKVIEQEILELKAAMKQYDYDILEDEAVISEMYTPESNSIDIHSNPINNNDPNEGSAYTYGSEKAYSEEAVSGNYKANGMADAYQDLTTAKDYKTALNSEEKGNLFKSIYHSANIYTDKETDLIHNRYRYGVLNAYQAVTNSKEFLFFTKPDLNIIPAKTTDGKPNYNDPIININGTTLSESSDLNGVLRNYPFWCELVQRYPGVIECLESSLHLNGRNDPFNHLLANMVQSNIDVPGLSAEMTETPSNTYGVNYNYRGSSEASDDGFDFSLEFKDTKQLPVYNFFKAYEEYETLKHHGVIAPWIGYIYDKVLHDQYSIYKFVVGDDGETILYYAKYYGVKSKSLPRDVFNSNTYDNGLSYSIDFNAAFVEDMNPLILSDFNRLAYEYWNSKKYFIDVYDQRYDKTDNRVANAAIVTREVNGRIGYQIMGIGQGNKLFYDDLDNQTGGIIRSHTKEPGGYCYKLKWKGDATV